MSVKKYINIDKDGYKVENQSPLSPAWMFSGKQNEGKVLTGGPDGFVIWAEGGSGSGTLDYEVLNNKPQINGLTLIGNITLHYLSNVEVSGNTLTFTHANGLSTTYTPSFPQITQYLKSASISQDNKTLTILDANGNNITFTPQSSEAIDQYIKSISVSNTDPNFISITYTNQASIASSFNVPKVFLQDINVNGNNLTITKYANNQASTVEYSPNIPQEYVKSVSVSGNTLTLTKQNDTQIAFGISTEVVNSAIASYLQNNFFTILKRHLGSGFIIDDNNKLVSVSTVPQAPMPTFTGIFSYDEAKNRYRYYDESTIFNSSGNIKYMLLDIESSEPTSQVSFPNEIARAIFNEKIFIKDQMGNLNGTNHLSFLSDCTSFNQPLDFSNCNWTKIGDNFLMNCINFNSTITFNLGIQQIGTYFMSGCTSFNQPLTNLITPVLTSIAYNFLMGCTSFNQDVDFSNVASNCKIDLDNFMFDCKSLSSHQIRFGNKVLVGDYGLFKVADFNDTDFLKAFATNDTTALSYTVGVHIQSIYSKAQLDNFYFTSPVDGLRYYPFRNANGDDGFYRKLIVNGVE